MAKSSAFAKLKERDAPAPPPVATPTPDPVREVARPGRGKNPGRVGFKTVIFYVPPTVSRAMKQLALDEDTTQQDLMVEAVGLLMKSRGRAVPG